jgi:hypothetical protein
MIARRIFRGSSTLKSRGRLLTCSLWAFLLFHACPAVNAQTRAQTIPPSSRHPVPLPMLYRHFLAYQSHLDEVGAQLDLEGKDGSEFRDHYQQKLGFTSEDFAPVRSAAFRLNATLKDEDAKIKAAVQAARAQHPRKLASPFDLPPVPEELKQMQKEKDAMIQREVDQLNTELGPERAAKLQALIQNDFAPNVHAYSHDIPHHDPLKNPLPPFPQGVRP